MTPLNQLHGVRVSAVSACYLCGNGGTRLHDGLCDLLFGAPGSWALRRCDTCGLVWLDPRPEPEDVPKLYQNYYTHEPIAPAHHPILRAIKAATLASAFGYPAASNRFFRALGKLWSKIGLLRDAVGRTVNWLPACPQGRLLDVGCGSGEFLSQMRSLGWIVQGVEPDPVARRHATEAFGLDVPFSTLEEAAFANDSFDAVALTHVVEHLVDPIATLAECRRILSKRGTLVLITPNVKSLASRWFGDCWRGLEPPRHLFLFSPATLSACAEKAGLHVTAVRTVASAASYMWDASLAVQRAASGRASAAAVRSSRIAGPLFGALESALTLFFSAGEEIVLTASKR